MEPPQPDPDRGIPEFSQIREMAVTYALSTRRWDSESQEGHRQIVQVLHWLKRAEIMEIRAGSTAEYNGVRGPVLALTLGLWDWTDTIILLDNKPDQVVVYRGGRARHLRSPELVKWLSQVLDEE